MHNENCISIQWSIKLLQLRHKQLLTSLLPFLLGRVEKCATQEWHLEAKMLLIIAIQSCSRSSDTPSQHYVSKHCNRKKVSRLKTFCQNLSNMRFEFCSVFVIKNKLGTINCDVSLVLDDSEIQISRGLLFNCLVNCTLQNNTVTFQVISLPPCTPP